MSRVLLVGKEWKARALLRAQLLEEGVDAEAYETVRTAIAAVEGNELLPGLIVADLSASDDPATEADQLAAWAPQIPIWIVAGRSLIVGKSLQGRGFKVILFLPVDVGELVEQIKQRLEKRQ